MLLVRACDAETFVSWTLLERAGVQRHTVLATLCIIYPYEEMRGWEFYLLKSVVCVFSILIPHGVTHLLLTPPIPFPFQVRLTSKSDCYRIGALGRLEFQEPDHGHGSSADEHKNAADRTILEISLIYDVI
ncbi:hypothetical protein YC2023_024197 [Brassica napus]